MDLVETYRPIFDLSPVPMLLAAPDGVIQLVNRELAEMFEYDEGALVDEPVECLIPPALRAHHPHLRNAFHRVPAKRRMGQERTLEGVTRTGRVVSLELALTPITHDNGTWTLVTVIDTSAHKRGETLAHATLDAAASAMVMVDDAGMIVSVNRSGLELFGYAEGELVGQRVEALVPDEIRAVHHVFRNSFFEGSESRAMGSGTPLFGRHKNGTEFRLEVALTPVEVDDKRMVLATIVDLSERLAAERALAGQHAAEAQASRLAHLNDELTRFAYSASHDLKAPLSTITGLLELSLEDLQEGETDVLEENMRAALDLSKRGAEKIEAVLRLARSGEREAKAEPLDLDAAVKRIWKGITKGVDAPPKLHAELALGAPFSCDAAAMEIVLENLLSNAVKFREPSRDAPGVWARVKQDRDWIEVAVKDNGVGVPESEHEAIFGMFRKLRDDSGDGLGLALARKQIDGMGGTIRCESGDDNGAIFTFRVPNYGPDNTEIVQ